MLQQVKIIYQEFFHLKGGRVPHFALIAEETRIGLLLIHLSEEQAQGDSVENTLSMYVEFGEKDASSVLQAAAALLCAYDDNMYPDYLKRFWEYSRKFVPGRQEEPLAQLPSLELPTCLEGSEREHTFLSSEIALPSIRHNRRKCACYLRKLSESDEFPSSLILISAGRVTRETLQQFANDHSLGKLIVLTLSATVQEELDLRSAAERYIPETIRERLILGVKKLFSRG